MFGGACNAGVSDQNVTFLLGYDDEKYEKSDKDACILNIELSECRDFLNHLNL